MKRDICPNCNKKGLEKVKTTPFFDELFECHDKEWYGCIYCGQAFFKKIEIEREEE
jgi:DNA-directed RNA polymerase subunit RPC12/RpoP